MDSSGLMSYKTQHRPRLRPIKFLVLSTLFVAHNLIINNNIVIGSIVNFQQLQVNGCNIIIDDSWPASASPVSSLMPLSLSLQSPPQTNSTSNLTVTSILPPTLAPSNVSSSTSNVTTNGFTNGQLITSGSIGIECQNITTDQFHDQLNLIRLHSINITSIAVRDSNLSSLGNLPQSINELRKLVFSNTSIDLEVLKEGSESLNQLSTLEIINEKISNIPQNFFQEMQSLKELRLENDEIASLDADAFHNLEDSLEVLILRKNRFNRFPMAVNNLAQLTVLDLSDNDIVIDTQDSDLPDKLETLLQLRELRMIRFNCTCEFGWSPFFEWIARTHISGVGCNAPDKFKSQEIIVLRRDELCEETNASASSSAAASPPTQRVLAPSSISLLLEITTLCAALYIYKIATNGQLRVRHER